MSQAHSFTDCFVIINSKGVADPKEIFTDRLAADTLCQNLNAKLSQTGVSYCVQSLDEYMQEVRCESYEDGLIRDNSYLDAKEQLG